MVSLLGVYYHYVATDSCKHGGNDNGIVQMLGAIDCSPPGGYMLGVDQDRSMIVCGRTDCTSKFDWLKISCHAHVEANPNIVAPSSSGWSSHAPTCCVSLLLVVVAIPLMLQLVVYHCS